MFVGFAGLVAGSLSFASFEVSWCAAFKPYVDLSQALLAFAARSWTTRTLGSPATPNPTTG